MPALLLSILARSPSARAVAYAVAVVPATVSHARIRPDDHQLTLAEILAVGFHLGNGFTAPCADISESAQLLTD